MTKKDHFVQKTFKTVTFKVQLPDRSRKAANDFESLKKKYLRRVSTQLLDNGYEERRYEVIFPRGVRFPMHQVKHLIEDLIWVIRKTAVSCVVNREIVGESEL